jgi:PPOX class probable F420-dependent enzyme
MAEQPLAVDAAARYLSLATYRRDGREVRTPVWFVLIGGRYYCFSAGDAGKVKRLRGRARAAIAACSARGAPRGPWFQARATLVADPVLEKRVYAALRARYGWQMALLDVLARLGGRHARRAVIEIVPTEEAARVGPG